MKFYTTVGTLVRTKDGITISQTRDDMKTYKPNDGDEITFRLTVRNKVTSETQEYIFMEELKLPYDIEEYFM